MRSREWTHFEETFNENYQQKNYTKIIDDIPKLLQFECTTENVSAYQRLSLLSMFVLKANKTISDKLLKQIFEKYQCVIRITSDPIKAIERFICLEYACELSNFSEAVNGQLIENLADEVLNKFTTGEYIWLGTGQMTLNRFIIVAVKLESRLSLRNGCTLKFATAQKAIKFFSSIVTDDRKTAYTEYLGSTLQSIISYRDENADGVNKLRLKIRCLVESKSKIVKDIAIMMSQIIHAGSLLISKGSLQFKHQMFVILTELYDIVRIKSLSAYQYIVHKSYKSICCDKLNTHLGLHIIETVRSVFVESMNSDNFNETLVSVMSNYASAESEIIAHFDCRDREILKSNLWRTFHAVTVNIGKIVTTCGLERAKRTLQKFLATKWLQPSEYCYITAALGKICKGADNKTEQINWKATDLLYNGTTEKNRIASMYAIHVIQNELDDPKLFETISSIVNGLPKKDYPLHFNPVQLQLLQINVEIDYPQLSALCMQKLVADMREMDFYKSDQGCYANLCKSGVCYLFCLMQSKLYKSNVKYEKAFQPLDEKFVLLKNEIEVIENLQEALNCLAKFLRDKDVWMANEDKTDYIPFAEKLLLRIAETLINRHYKDLAVTAFDLFYKFAKLVDRPLNQMIAAGYLVENIHLTSTMPEKEIVTELQSFIMQKLKDVNTMSADELGSYLFSFLQLTMYTMRYQLNIDHAKKYMQAINKLLNKYDSKKEKYLAARLKYAEVMFELIVNDPDTTITPVTFIEDIFHRFKNLRFVSNSDYLTVPGIVLDLLITLYAFTQPRYELRYTTPLCWTVHYASIKNGYLFLLAKTTILSSSEMILTNGKNLEPHMKQLDVLFASQRPAERTESEIETITWNKEITSLIHSDNCKCFQCTNKFLNGLNMEVAALKASAVYFKKDYQKSLESYQQIYRHWNALNTQSYSGMLMHYSNCLISNRLEDKSKRMLNEALDVCNDSARAQDISVRLLLNTVKVELQIDQRIRSFADELRPKAVPPKKKVSSKPSLSSTATKERKTYTKRSNLRN